MKKTILLSTLALVSTLAFASEMFVDGTVKFGADFKELGKSNADDAVPVFVDAMINNKQCVIELQAINKDGLSSYERINLVMEGKGTKIQEQNTTRIQARVLSISCDNTVKEARGWLYDESGNIGAKNLTVGTKVKIVFAPEIETKGGDQLKKALSSSTQVQKNSKN